MVTLSLLIHSLLAGTSWNLGLWLACPVWPEMGHVTYTILFHAIVYQVLYRLFLYCLWLNKLWGSLIENKINKNKIKKINFLMVRVFCNSANRSNTQYSSRKIVLLQQFQTEPLRLTICFYLSWAFNITWVYSPLIFIIWVNKDH